MKANCGNRLRHSPPEQHYLLLCGRSIMAGVAGDGEPIPPGLNWERLLHVARRNRLIPQLYRCLGPHRERVPEPAWQQVETRAQAIARNNELLTAELLELVEHFRRNDCPMIPYKGPVLAVLAYGDLGLRQFSDLDLLIPRSAARQAADLLEKRGYRLEHRSSRAADAVYLTTEYHYLYRHPDSGIAVELHGEAIPCYFSFALSNEELWSRQETFVLKGRPVPSLSREDLALLLAMHGAKHEWECAELALSLAGLLRASPDLRWDVLIARAEALGARRVLLLGVSLADEFFGYSPPALVSLAIGQDAMVARLTGDVWDYYLGVRQPSTSAIQTALFQVRSRERGVDRLKYWLFRIFAPNWEEVEWLPLPRALFPLYWLLRPVRILWHYGPEALGLRPPRAIARRHH
jgi:hypothetical protein